MQELYKMSFMSYTLKFIFQKDVEKIFSVFTDLFGIRIAFFSSSGEELNVGKDKPICQYCQLLRQKLDFEEQCLSLDRRKRAEATEQGTMIVYQCHGGMTEAITPIYIENELIGYVMIGQFRTSDKPLPKAIARMWREQFDSSELEDFWEQMPVYEASYADNILKLFSVLVDFIISQHMIEIKGSNSILPLVSFMQEHVEENLDLAQAAKILCTSQSSLSHKLKKITGKSFKQFQIDLKLAKADEYFTSKPEMTVKEVSFRLGYDDPFYFSRLYKAHRGKPPTTVKNRRARSKKRQKQKKSPSR